MKNYIYIQADVNDAEYVSELSEISPEQLTAIMPLIKLINEHPETHNWDDAKKYYVTSGKCSQEVFDLFDKFMPYGGGESGDGHIHTIETINIMEVSKITTLIK